MGPRLQELSKRRPDIAIRIVDINRPNVDHIDFDAPVAQQYGVPFVPFLIVMGPDGKIMCSGHQAAEQVAKCEHTEDVD